MGSGASLTDIDALLDVAPSAFATAQDDYLVAVKQNYDSAGNLIGGLDLAAIVSQHTAEWGNRVDDLIRGLQQRTRGEARIGTYDTPEDDHQAVLAWVAAASQVYLRNAGFGAYRALRLASLYLNGGAHISDGAGSPENNFAAIGGSLRLDTTNRTVYVKTTATGTTGWVDLQSVGAQVLSSDSTEQTFSNTDADEELARASVPANTLSTDGDRVLFTLRGDVYNNGASRNGTLTIVYGGVTIWQDQLALANINLRRPMRLDLEFLRRGSTTGVMHGNFVLGSANAGAPTTGTGGTFLGAGNTGFAMLTDPFTIAPSTEQTFEVNWQHDTATANLVTRVQYWGLRTE